MMCESGFPFCFFSSIMLCTKRLSAPLAVGFTEYENHTDLSRGEQDPEGFFLSAVD